MEELKSCPFCGSDKVKITVKRSGGNSRTGDAIQVICNKCKARGPIFSSWYETRGRGYNQYSTLQQRPEKALTPKEAEQAAKMAWNIRA